ncbi:MAG: MATE family efflux transporter [Pseudomonadota bacterium]
MTRLRPHIRALTVLALPLIGSHLAQQAISITDTVMLGWYSVEALAAVTLGATLYFVAFVLGSGSALAVMPMVARAAAEGNEAQVRRVTRMGLWLAALTGVAIYPLFWFAEPILLALGQTEEVAAGARVYLRIAGAAMAFSLILMVLKSFLSALERTGPVLSATLAGAGLNALLNWLLIFGNMGAPELGIAGAAVASLGTNLLICLVLGVYAARARALRVYALFARLWRLDWPGFAAVFTLGWPIGLTQLAEVGLFSAASLMMGWLGTVELAAHGVALQIASVTFMVHLGLSSAATVRAGRAFGRQDFDGLRDGALAALILSGAMVGLTVALFLGVPELLIGLFLDPAEPERGAIIAIGVALLAVGALFQLADAAQVIAIGLLRGLQDTRMPMVFAAVSYWAVGLPASYFLGFVAGLDGPGIWLGLVVGLVAAAALMLPRFWARLARLARMRRAARAGGIAPAGDGRASSGHA